MSNTKPTAPPLANLPAYREAVSRAMVERYGITWDDACGDEDPILRAAEAGETAGAFVAWWGDKYGMDPIGTHWLA